MKKITIVPAVLIMTLTLFAGFEGTYEVEGPGYYAELNIAFQPGPEQGYYKLEWNLGTPGDVYFGAGIEAFGILGVAMLDQDYFAVYTRLDSEFTGLQVSMELMGGEEIHPELVEDAILLEPSEAGLAGTYAVSCENNYSEAVAAYTMILEPSGDVLKVTRVEESGDTYPGVGIVIGDVLITGVLVGDTKEVSIFKIKDDELYGDWMDYSCDGEQSVQTGIMSAVKIKVEG
jgi:hypothetical protein